MQKLIYKDLNIKKFILNLFMWSWLLILIYPALYGLFLMVASFIFVEYQYRFTEGSLFLLFTGTPIIASFMMSYNMSKHIEYIKKIYIKDDKLCINTKESFLGKIEENIINIGDIEFIDITIGTRLGYKYSTRYCLKLNIKMKDNKELYNLNVLYDNGLEPFISFINNKQYLPPIHYFIKNDSNNRYLNQLELDIKSFEQNNKLIKERTPIATTTFALFIQILMLLFAWYIIYMEVSVMK